MFQPPRGTRDFLPETMRRRNWVLDEIKKTYETYGFEPLGTPAFENWELLKIKSGQDIINQIYYFKDKSERELGLRFEWTASLARVVSSHRELQMPFKRYAMGPVWRYERPSETRFREFWQADADIIGVNEVIADAEILAVAVECLRRLGFKDFIIKLNDRRILQAIIEGYRINQKQVLDVFRTIDKLDKLGTETVVNQLSNITEDKAMSQKLIDSVSLKGKPTDILKKSEQFVKNNQVGKQGCDAISKIFELAESFGFAQFLMFDLSLARGLDYYTGSVFEVSAKGYESFGSIAGGGRYDEIIQLFGGEPTPAVGISFGIERLVSLLEKVEVFRGINLGTEIFVAVVQESVRKEAIKVAQNLRRNGFSTELNMLERSLSKQFEHADRKKIQWVIIVGEKEIEKNLLTIRNMKSGEQFNVKLDELANTFTEHLKELQV
jgi:histidyl-tRNA synthetase